MFYTYPDVEDGRKEREKTRFLGSFFLLIFEVIGAFFFLFPLMPAFDNPKISQPSLSICTHSFSSFPPFSLAESCGHAQKRGFFRGRNMLVNV